jgi:hypothetical protein
MGLYGLDDPCSIVPMCGESVFFDLSLTTL